MNENGNEIIVSGEVENDLGLNNESIIALAEQAERRVDAINKIMKAALKITTINDWVKIGGVPYLQETGAAKIRSLFGIGWQISEPIKETRPDGHYTFTYKGTFSLSGVTIDAVGARSSYDEFFTGKEDEKTGKTKKSIDEIDIRDVKVAAYTNCINNGIKRILPGLRNLTLDDLKNAGFDVDKMKGYGFNTKAPNGMDEESLGLKEQAAKMLNEICGGDETKIKKMIKKHTSFTGKDGKPFEGYDSIDRITEKAMPIFYGKIKKGYEEWQDKQSDEPKDEPKDETKPNVTDEDLPWGNEK